MSMQIVIARVLMVLAAFFLSGSFYNAQAESFISKSLQDETVTAPNSELSFGSLVQSRCSSKAIDL